MKFPATARMAAVLFCAAAIVSCSQGRTNPASGSAQQLHDENVNFPLTVKRELDLKIDSHDAAVFTQPRTVVAVAWSPDGSKIAAASNYGGTLTVWDSAGRTLNQIQTSDGPNLAGSIAFAHGSSELVFPSPPGAPPNTALGVWDLSTGKVVAFIGGNLTPGPTFQGQGQQFAMSRDQSKIAVVTNFKDADNHTISDTAIYDTDQWRLLRTFNFGNLPTSISFPDDDHKVIVGSLDSTVTVQSLERRSPPRRFRAFVPKFGDRFIGALAISPDSELVFAGATGGMAASGDHDEEIRLENEMPAATVLRTSDGAQVATFKLPAPELGQGAWDPRGRFVAFLDSEGYLILWRPTEPAMSYAKIALPSRSLVLAINQDGSRIAVGTTEGVSVYAVSDGSEPSLGQEPAMSK